MFNRLNLQQMKTLIIITIVLVITILVLLVLSYKKLIEKHDYIMAQLALISSTFKDVIAINEKTTTILNKLINLDAILNNLNDNISNSMSNIETALKATTNSINAIEEEQCTNFNKINSNIDKGNKANATNAANLISVIDSVNQTIMGSIDLLKLRVSSIIDVLEKLTKFNEHHRRVTEIIDNKLIEAKTNRTNSINAFEEKIDTIGKTMTEVVNEIITNNELLREVRENQAKNSLPNLKTKKSSSKDSKHQNKLKTAKIDDNSQQERIDEIARQQNK